MADSLTNLILTLTAEDGSTIGNGELLRETGRLQASSATIDRELIFGRIWARGI